MSAQDRLAVPPPFNGHVAVFGDPSQPIVRIIRRFPQRPERVWEALTGEQELRAWYPTRVEMEPVAGGRISFAFPGGQPFYGTVRAAVAPRLLEFTTLSDTLRWEIGVDGDGSVLILSNSVADPGHTPYTAAGFHIALNQLATVLGDGAAMVRRIEMPPPQGLVDHYRTALYAGYLTGDG